MNTRKENSFKSLILFNEAKKDLFQQKRAFNEGSLKKFKLLNN